MIRNDARPIQSSTRVRTLSCAAIRYLNTII